MVVVGGGGDGDGGGAGGGGEEEERRRKEGAGYGIKKQNLTQVVRKNVSTKHAASSRHARKLNDRVT